MHFKKIIFMFNKDIIVIMLLRLPWVFSSKKLFVSYLSVSRISLNANVLVIL